MGMRVQDVVRGVDYLLARSDIEPDGVDLVGRGWGAVGAVRGGAG